MYRSIAPSHPSHGNPQLSTPPASDHVVFDAPWPLCGHSVGQVEKERQRLEEVLKRREEIVESHQTAT